MVSGCPAGHDCEDLSKLHGSEPPSAAHKSIPRRFLHLHGVGRCNTGFLWASLWGSLVEILGGEQTPSVFSCSCGISLDTDKLEKGELCSPNLTPNSPEQGLGPSARWEPLALCHRKVFRGNHHFFFSYAPFEMSWLSSPLLPARPGGDLRHKLC